MLLKLDPLAEHSGDVFEHLWKVAPGLPLHEDGGDEEREIGRFNALGHGLEGVLGAATEADLVVAAAELLAEGSGQLGAHHLKAQGQAVAGAQGAIQEVQPVGQLLGQ